MDAVCRVSLYTTTEYLLSYLSSRMRGRAGLSVIIQAKRRGKTVFPTRSKSRKVSYVYTDGWYPVSRRSQFHAEKPVVLQSLYRGRILGRNQDKRLKSFPPCYSQPPLQLWLEISIFSNSHNLKGVRRKIWKKTIPPSLKLLRNPYRNHKSENSQDYAQKPQRNCTLM